MFKQLIEYQVNWENLSRNNIFIVEDEVEKEISIKEIYQFLSRNKSKYEVYKSFVAPAGIMIDEKKIFFKSTSRYVESFLDLIIRCHVEDISLGDAYIYYLENDYFVGDAHSIDCFFVSYGSKTAFFSVTKEYGVSDRLEDYLNVRPDKGGWNSFRKAERFSVLDRYKNFYKNYDPSDQLLKSLIYDDVYDNQLLLHTKDYYRDYLLRIMIHQNQNTNFYNKCILITGILILLAIVLK